MCHRFSVKILNVSGILICWIFTGYIDRVLNISRVLNMPEFWICSGNNFKITLNSNIQGKLWKIRYVRSVWLKPEFFFQLWTIFFSCEFLERVWEIMRHPRYYLTHHPGISSNITSASHFSTPSTPPTLGYQPSYAGTPQMPSLQ